MKIEPIVAKADHRAAPHALREAGNCPRRSLARGHGGEEDGAAMIAKPENA